MLSPPFTLQKIIVLALFAVAAWAYLIWLVRGKWIRYRQKREVITEGGLGRAGHRQDRRTVLLIIVFAIILLAVAYSCTWSTTGRVRPRLDSTKSMRRLTLS
jgi:hypothetical protein